MKSNVIETPWEAHYRREIFSEGIPEPQIDSILEEADSFQNIKEKLADMGYGDESERMEKEENIPGIDR